MTRDDACAIDRRISTLTAERGDLLLRLRREAVIPDVPSAIPAASRDARDVPTPTVGLPAIGRLRDWLASAGPQTLLAAGGVLLLAVAAIVFAAVTWRDLSLLIRAAVLLIASMAAWLTKALVARGLRRTAEATGVLAVALLAVAAAVAAAMADGTGPVAVAVASAAAGGWVLAARLRVHQSRALAVEGTAAAGLRARPAASSWPVLGSGLGLLVVPTGVPLRDDPGDLVRLTAVVPLGSLTQHDVVTDLLPRWLLLAAGGCLLLWLSISYEHQLQRMTSARRRLLAMR
ncbi:MAG: hypothetical protein KY460_16045 [Actinobacteria bacterium]|nr:hypothetical protein [Actinomycetota bacterium]